MKEQLVRHSTPTSTAGAGALRAALANDRHRPLYHFVAPANWMNDPNGCFFWKGSYHLFYQYNPKGAFWSKNSNWGHAISSDLVHWQDCPIALAPSPGGPDKEGCWSGCVVDDNGTPTAFYTGIEPQTVCAATSADDLITWKQLPTPVIAGPPSGMELTGFPSINGHSSADFRDPFVWRESGRWYLIVGTGIREKGGAALLYDSEDLRQWRYLHPILMGVIGPNCNMWECPVLLSFGNRSVLFVCPHPEANHVYWISGEWREGIISEQQRGKVDLGGYVYAPQCLYDPIHSRYLLWTWIKEGRTAEAQRMAGWSGSLSLPKECWLEVDGKLAVAPARELALLRQESRAAGSGKLTPLSQDPFLELAGDCFEIEAELSFDEPTICDLYLRVSPNQAEYTLVSYDSVQQTLAVDCTCSSLSAGVDHQLISGNLPPDEKGQVRFRIFLDCSILEIFLADASCITQRIYPTRQDSLMLSFRVRKGSVIVHRLFAWKLASIWPSVRSRK